MADTKISALTAKTTPVTNDSIPIYDSVAASTKRITWTQTVATLKTYFDSIYGVTAVNGEDMGGSGTARTLAHTPIGVVIICDGAVILHPTDDYTRVTTAVTFSVAPDTPKAYYKY